MSGTIGADPSIYAQLGRGVTPLQTPVEAMGHAAQTANAMGQAQSYQANRLVGQAMQQAIDPKTGVPDLARFNKLIAAAGPDAALAARNAIGQSQELQGAQSDLAAKQRMSAAKDTAGLLSLPDSQLEGGAPVFSYLQSMRESGAISQQTYDTYTKNLPPQGAPASAFRQALTSHLVGTLGGQQAIDAVIGTRDAMDNGQSVQPGVRGGVLNPNGAGFTPQGGATQTYPSRAQLLNLHPTTDGSGRATVTPTGTLANQAGAGALTGPAGQAMPGAPNAMGTGRYNQQQQPAVTPGSAPTGPAPGTLESNKADTDLYLTDRSAVPATEQRIQTLQQARSALQQARTGKGPAGSTLQNVLSVINTVSPDTAKSIANATGTDVEKYDLAKKYLTDYARSNGAATHSDAQLAAAQGSNASVDITNQAAQDVVSLQIGRERQKIAQVNEHDPKTNGVGYGQHASRFASDTDARGFAWDTYSGEQRAAILKSVAGNNAAKERLATSIGMARRLKLLQTPAGGQ